MPITADVLTFWGKARPGSQSLVAYHPIVYHLLDVAAVADVLLDTRRLARARAARLLGIEPEQAQQLLVTLAALHDLGKFSPAFQAKAPACWPHVLGVYNQPQATGTRHTDDGYALWYNDLAPALGERLWRGGADVLEALSQAVFGHHGRPVVTSRLRERPADVFGAIGRQMALECARAVIELLLPTPLDSPSPAFRQVRAASWWVAGLITIADWIGSRERWFPYRAPDVGDDDLRAYWAYAHARAREALRNEGLEPPTPAGMQSFDRLTGITSPSPAQLWTSSAELPPGPLLVIIEDVTGAGKTEAAQMLVHRLMATGRADGAYWAMPTQATANAMYLRQGNAIDALFTDDNHRPSLALAHGQARLHDGFRQSVLSPDESEPRGEAALMTGGEELPSGAACAAFFADDRRAALLADVGAGTIDQALLGVLPTKFNAVRLFGVAGKVLVVDEVHAYDAYMGVEIQELLRFQAALGGCAVLLSATLALEQREKLVRAWKEGVDLGRRIVPRLFAPNATGALVRRTDYPLATVVAAGDAGVHEEPLGAAQWSHRKVGVRFVRDIDAALYCVIAAHESGAAVAWVRNTVNDCLDAAAALRARGVTPLLFHARFAQADRQVREQEVLHLFGKNASDSDRRGRVLIATQVIEQSLDLDFDVLVSDLAPVDLLIQRAGRLWRHPMRNATRPLGLEPEIIVLAPPAEPLPMDNKWMSTLLPGTAAVYQDPGVLWRTVRVLEQAKSIVTPTGVRELIESVYGCDDVPEALALEAQQAEGKRRGDASAATYQVLQIVDGYDGNASGWVDDLRAATRLGDAQTTIRLARVAADGALEPWARMDGPPWKSWSLSEVRVSAKRIPPGALADPQHRASVAAARAEWGRFEQEIPVLPLVAVESGVWRGVLMDPGSERTIHIVYTTDVGLRIVKPPS